MQENYSGCRSQVASHIPQASGQRGQGIKKMEESKK
jgi:hypothetical protein